MDESAAHASKLVSSAQREHVGIAGMNDARWLNCPSSALAVGVLAAVYEFERARAGGHPRRGAGGQGLVGPSRHARDPAGRPRPAQVDDLLLLARLGEGREPEREVAVEAHGGDVRLVTAPGSGATFSVDLPLLNDRA